MTDDTKERLLDLLARARNALLVRSLDTRQLIAEINACTARVRKTGIMDGTPDHSAEWWEGHRRGFAKGLEEARQQAIALAAEHPDGAAVLRLLASILHELQSQ